MRRNDVCTTASADLDGISTTSMLVNPLTTMMVEKKERATVTTPMYPMRMMTTALDLMDPTDRIENLTTLEVQDRNYSSSPLIIIFFDVYLTISQYLIWIDLLIPS